MNDTEVPQDELAPSEESKPEQIVEPVTPEKPETTDTPAPVEPEEPKATPLPEPADKAKPPKKKPSFLVRALRWLLIVLVLFGLGALLVMFVLYIPARNNLMTAQRNIVVITNKSEAELRAAEQEIERLESFEGQNETLKETLDLANLRLTVLEIRTDVLTAQLALLNGEGDEALVALSTTSDKLDQLAQQLPPELKDFVETLQKRLDLALTGIENDDTAAESDLNILIIKLLELEDALFH